MIEHEYFSQFERVELVKNKAKRLKLQIKRKVYLLYHL